jgi:hypothetical protein
MVGAGELSLSLALDTSPLTQLEDRWLWGLQVTLPPPHILNTHSFRVWGSFDPFGSEIDFLDKTCPTQCESLSGRLTESCSITLQVLLQPPPPFHRWGT